MVWWMIGLLVLWTINCFYPLIRHYYHEQPYKLVWRKREPLIQIDEERKK